MSDFERRLQDALKNATSDYRPTDPHEAKAQFLSRFRRRRFAFYGGSVALAGAAAIAAFLLLPGQLSERAARPLPPAAELELQALSVIEVGGDPSGIAFGNDLVWVADTGDGTVSVIDPLTNSVRQTYEVGGSPDDVAVGLGAAWVSDSGRGIVTKLVFDNQTTPVTIPVGDPGRHLDVAPGSGAIWVVSEGDSLYRIDPVTDTVTAVPTEGVEGVSDVAAGQDQVMVLGSNTLGSVDPLSRSTSVLAGVAPSGNQDLQMSEGSVWVANGDAGEVTRYELETGDAAPPVYVGGNFTAMASGEDAMWMLSGDEGDAGNLVRIDPPTNELVGQRVGLGGRPYDVTTGAGSVWVVNHDSDSVVRLDPNALPEADGEPHEMARPLYAFAADGEIYIEDVEGRLTQVTDTEEEERYPSLSPDANSIAFQRGPPDPAAEVVILDLLDGGETTVGKGEYPSFGPDGRLAYVVDNRGPTALIRIVRPGSDEAVDITPIPSDEGLRVDVHNIVWDLPGEYIYYNAGWEGFVLYQADAAGDNEPFHLDPGNSQPGTTHLSPIVRGRDSVHIIRICCSLNVDDNFDGAEIGVVRFTEGGPDYSTVPLEVEGLPGLFGDPWLMPAGRMVAAGGSDETRTYREGGSRSWIVATPSGIWLLNEQGETTALHPFFGFEEYAGITVAPQYRQ